MNMKRTITMLLVATLFTSLIISLFVGCSKGDKKKASDEKTQIKVQYVAGRMNLDLEKVLEKKFPNVDIVADEIVGDTEYIIKQEMEHNLEPDIYLYEGLKNMDDSLIKEHFYDLANESFTNNYYLSAVSDCVKDDGTLYYLPGPIYIYGIVYDKTAFKELKLSVPHSYSEFVKLLKTVRDMNLKGKNPDDNDPDKMITVDIEPFVPTLKWSDMGSIVFNTYNYEDVLRGVDNKVWLNDYQKGKSSMVGHMEKAADKFLKLFEDGIISTDYWKMRAPVRTTKLYKYHTSLMTIECQSAIGFNKQENEDNKDNMHEIGMMPFYTSDKKDSDYVYSMARCLFGMTKKAAKDNAKKEAILKIFDYFSTKEGQGLLIEGGGGEINLLKEDTMPDDPFYDEVRDTILEGRAIKNFFYAGKNGGVELYMHGAVPDLVNGKLSVEKWLKEADKARDIALDNKNDEEPISYGTVKKTLTMEETAVVIGESYIHETRADIGIVPCTGNFGMKFRLFEGPITDKTIDSITTTRMATGVIEGDPGHAKLVVVSIKGQELIDLLNSYGDTFVATAGLDVEYAPNRPKGEHYVSIKYHGKDLDTKKTYKAAVIRGTAKKIPVKKIYDITFSDMFINYVDSIGGIIKGAPKSLKIVK